MNSDYYLVRNTGSVPAQAAIFGNQSGSGELGVGVALTEHGEIPGKVHMSPRGILNQKDFGPVCLANKKDPDDPVCLTNKKNPDDPVCLANKKDPDDVCGVAKENDGTIFGKVYRCCYGYDGKEYTTTDFKWLVAPNYALYLRKNDDSGPPAGALGIQNADSQDDDSQDADSQGGSKGMYYLAVANVGNNGKIPGKAHGKTCWYSYKGKEVSTGDFAWIVQFTWK